MSAHVSRPRSGGSLRCGDFRCASSRTRKATALRSRSGEAGAISPRRIDQRSLCERHQLPAGTVPPNGQSRLSPTDPPAFGTGDIVPMFALSPSHPGNLIWGVGPTFSLPTATDNLASRQWAAGPAAVALLMPDPWVFGLLINQWWSIGHPSGDAPMNRINAQLFLVYNFPDG